MHDICLLSEYEIYCKLMAELFQEVGQRF